MKTHSPHNTLSRIRLNATYTSSSGQRIHFNCIASYQLHCSSIYSNAVSASQNVYTMLNNIYTIFKMLSAFNVSSRIDQIRIPLKTQTLAVQCAMCGVHCAVCSFALWVLMCRVMATKLILVLYQTGSKGELRLRVSTSLLYYDQMTNLESVEIARKRWGTQKNWAKKPLMKIMLHLDFSGRST